MNNTSIKSSAFVTFLVVILYNIKVVTGAFSVERLI